MDSQVQRVTVEDVERRFLADKTWWATRIGFALAGAVFVFVPGLAEGLWVAVYASAFTGLLVFSLLFRKDHLFFGHTYKIGGMLNPATRNYIWVEQPGEFPAHNGSVIVLVRVAGLFRPRRSITVFDSRGDDSPFGRPIDMNDEGYFVVQRRRIGTARAKHIGGVIFLLLEDMQPLHRGPATVL